MTWYDKVSMKPKSKSAKEGVMILANEQDVMDRIGSLSVFSRLKSVADEKWMFKSKDRLGYIKFCAMSALHLASEDFDSNYKKYFRNPAVIDRFLKIITSVYLQVWLKTDPEAGRNIHAFYIHGYAPEVVRITRDGPNQRISPFRFSRDVLIRQSQKYDIIDSVILKQAKAEHSYYKKEKEEDQSTQQQDYAHKIPWERLCILSKMAERKLGIIDFLTERESPLIKGLRPESNQHLHECYQDYYDLYQLLDPARKNTKDMTDIEYVALAMMLQEMEYSYRFHAAVMMAKMVKSSYPSFDFDYYKDDLLLFWGRFAESDSIRPMIINNDTDLVFEFTSHDILSYADEMHYLCNCEERRRTGSDNLPMEFLVTMRNELLYERQALLYLFSIIPPREMPGWNEEDYRDARQFFEREYPIYQVYQQACTEDGTLDLGDIVHKRKCDTAYDNIRAFLTWIIQTSRDEELYNQESPGLKEIHDTLRKFTKKRYTPKSTKKGRPPKVK